MVCSQAVSDVNGGLISPLQSVVFLNMDAQFTMRT